MWAAEILGWFGDPRAAVPLIESLGDVSPEVRAEAAMGLGEIGDARALKRLLEILLSDPVPFVRTRAAQALGAIGHPKVIDHLIHVLKDPEWWVRIRAIEALEQIGRSAVGALLVALENDDDEVHRRAAMARSGWGTCRRASPNWRAKGSTPTYPESCCWSARRGSRRFCSETSGRQGRGRASCLSGLPATSGIQG